MEVCWFRQGCERKLRRKWKEAVNHLQKTISRRSSKQKIGSDTSMRSNASGKNCQTSKHCHQRSGRKKDRKMRSQDVVMMFVDLAPPLQLESLSADPEALSERRFNTKKLNAPPLLPTSQKPSQHPSTRPCPCTPNTHSSLYSISKPPHRLPRL